MMLSQIVILLQLALACAVC